MISLGMINLGTKPMTKDLQTLELALPLGSLNAYLYQVNQIPLLTAEEEFDYGCRHYDHGDLEAAQKLIMSHLRYVARVARDYAGYGLPHADLVQEGNVGLMKAVKRFNPHMGVRLVSFAVHWIKSEIHEYVIRNWRMVKIATTKAQRKLFFNLRKAKKRLGWFSQQEIQEVANDLNVSTAEVEKMEMRLNAHDASFHITSDDDDGPAYAPEQYLEDKTNDPLRLIESLDSTEQGKEALMSAFATLDDRSKDILNARWLTEKKSTLHDLAAKYKVSAERIRQLEKNAMKKLREKIETTS